ncbi:hypothetical protein H0H93_002391 [Arthromyces matolae]|nr:hypothetical protein H0H93_002391 [Arthromyces matolae]
MKFITLPLAVAFAAVTTSAYRVQFKQVKHQPSLHKRTPNFATASQLSVLATTDDQSSLDLKLFRSTGYWILRLVDKRINVPSTQLKSNGDHISDNNFEANSRCFLQSTTYNLTYAIGWAYGHISYAPVEFAGLSISSQALLDVTSAQNPALGYGANGVVGLGFTSLSTIDALVNHTGASTGRSLLYNMFATNPQEPNFLSFSLQRSSEANDEVQGIFAVGEYEPQYASVINQTAIPTWPVNNPTRWDVLLDAVIVNHANDTIVLPSTDVVGAPSNKAVILMDSGSSFTYAPKTICDAIYGGIEGASFDNASGQWIVPCGFEIDMALQIGGQVFPVHPLDVAPSGLSTNGACVGSFVPQTVSVGAGQFDWLVGDNFLRSVYSIYDFGDFDQSGNMGNPYMKLLSLVDPDQASIEFTSARGGTAKTNITYQGLDGAAVMPSFSISADTTSALERIAQWLPAMLAIVALNALVAIIILISGLVYWCRRRRTSKNQRRGGGRLSPMPLNPRHSYIAGSGLPAPNSSHVYEAISTAGEEAPIMASRSRGTTPLPRPSPSPSREHFNSANSRDTFSSGADLPPPMQPSVALPGMAAVPEDMPFSTARYNRGRVASTSSDSRHSYMSGLPSPTRPRMYEPVSMALTEATFVPPSPPFLSADETKLGPGDRPKSVA